MESAKRIVLVEDNGTHRILALQPNAPQVIIQVDGELYGLVQVKPRFLLYKKVLEPTKGKFNEFHPEQR